MNWSGRLLIGAMVTAGLGFVSIVIGLIMVGFSSVNPELYNLSNIPGWGGIALITLAIPFALASAIAYMFEN